MDSRDEFVVNGILTGVGRAWVRAWFSRYETDGTMDPAALDRWVSEVRKGPRPQGQAEESLAENVERVFMTFDDLLYVYQSKL